MAHARRSDVDWLRVLATYLLFAFHTAKVFDVPPYYHIKNAELSPGLGYFTGFVHQWHMPLFFLLAGWSAAGSIRLRGAAGFVRERVTRLVVPLAFGLVAFGPVLRWIELRTGQFVSASGRHLPADPTIGFFEYLPRYAELDHLTWAHLWFLAYLFTFSVLYLPLLARLVRRAPSDWTAPAWAVYLPIVPFAVIQLVLRPIWRGHQNLVDDWANFAYYSLYFLIGAALAHLPMLERTLHREAGRAGLIALVAYAGLVSSDAAGLSPVSLVWMAVAGWCTVVAILGLAARRFDVSNAALRWFAESAMPVYVLHQIAVVGVAFLVIELPLGIPAKLALVLVGAVILTLVAYLLVRPVAVLRVLLGMRAARAARSTDDGESRLTGADGLREGARMTGRLLLAAALVLGLAASPVRADPLTGAVPPLSSQGRWFTDALDRVVLLHGFNNVAKSAPYHPSAFGFGDDDAAFLASEGFTALRLGVVFQGLMPTPGVVEESYIDAIEATVDVLASHRIFVLLDFHQDGFAPMFNGNGLPNWFAITDGLPNPPDAVFPLYYVLNPAMQRAFEHFWADDPGPNGVPLQDYYRQGVEAVVARFADHPWVIGYDLMNEPWPGADWQACASPGCPALEAERLQPFHQKVGEPVRTLSSHQFVFDEPFVLFNFGQAQTTMPGTAERSALSFHAYAVGLANEVSVLANGVAAAERDAAPVMVTEFGASIDPALLTRLTGQMDDAMLPWLDWAYNESIIARRFDPAGPDNLRSTEAFAALVRPYPKAVAGTPQSIAFDPVTRVFQLAYAPTSPDGVLHARNVPTVISLPKRQYPTGYRVRVRGARVTSRPCAELLTLKRGPAPKPVTVTVTPTTRRCR